MAIMRYDPWRNLNQLQQEMNRLFESRLEGEDEGNGPLADWHPAVDVAENDDQYTITVDLPGVNPQDIDVTLEGDVLSIRGERREDHNQDSGTIRRAERIRGTFFRRFTLPETADPENVAARSNNGILQITIPKQKLAQSRRIEVQS